MSLIRINVSDFEMLIVKTTRDLYHYSIGNDLQFLFADFHKNDCHTDLYTDGNNR